MTAPGSTRWRLTCEPSSAQLEPGTEIAGEAGGADLPRRTLRVVGHSVVDDDVRRVVEQRVAGGGIAVARLSHRAGDDQPAVKGGELDGSARDRLERAHRTGGAEVVQPGGVGVPGEDLA